MGALAKLDRSLLLAMRTRAHGPRTEATMRALGLAGEYGAVWAVIGVLGAAASPSNRGQWLHAAALAPISIGLNFVVKRAVGRPRPKLRDLPPLAGAPTSLSFPSAHATSSLAAATSMGRIAPAMRPGLYGLATAICLTRPYLGMHYPSDVLAGAVLGTGLGRLAALSSRAAPRPVPKP